MINTLKKIGDVIFYIFIIICIVSTISIGKTKANGGGVSIFGYRLYTVLTESMSPTMNKGSLLLVKETDPTTIQKEDVITYAGNDGYSVTTHRVKDVHNESNLEFTTQGDANNDVDPERVSSERVVGKVIGHVPLIGATMEFIKSNINLLLGFLVVITIIGVIPKTSKA